MSDVNRTQPPTARVGEMRRLTFMYCDVVGSTELSRVHSLEAYHDLMEGYRRRLRRRDRAALRGPHRPLQGRRRAVGVRLPGRARERRRAGRARGAGAGAGGRRACAAPRPASRSRSASACTTAPSTASSTRTRSSASRPTSARATRRWPTPGTVVVSDEVRQLVEAHFELEAGEPQHVKGTPEPLRPFRVVGERARALAARLAGAADRPRRRAARPARGRWPSARPRACWSGGSRGSASRGSCRADRRARHRRRLHGSPFHADVGSAPRPRPARDALRHAARRTGGRAARRPRRGGRAARGWTPPRVPLLAPVLGLEPAAGYQPAAAEGQRLEEQVNQAVSAPTWRRCAPACVAEDLHWFDDATRDPARRRDRARRRVRRGHLAPLRARQLGGDRAAAARARAVGSR